MSKLTSVPEFAAGPRTSHTSERAGPVSASRALQTTTLRLSSAQTRAQRKSLLAPPSRDRKSPYKGKNH